MRVYVDEQIRKYLSPLMRDIYDTGTSTGLRISDILRLKVSDIRKYRPTIKEKKTNKSKRIYIPAKLRTRLLDVYTVGKADTDFIFTNKRTGKPITRQAVHKAFKQAEAQTGNNKNVGTHSMRKTYAQKQLRRGLKLKQIQKKLNHRDLIDTMRYLM